MYRDSQGQFISQAQFRAELAASRRGTRRFFDILLVVMIVTGVATILHIMDVYNVPHICVG